jgi:hypothetical protein
MAQRQQALAVKIKARKLPCQLPLKATLGTLTPMFTPAQPSTHQRMQVRFEKKVVSQVK